MEDHLFFNDEWSLTQLVETKVILHFLRWDRSIIFFKMFGSKSGNNQFFKSQILGTYFFTEINNFPLLLSSSSFF